jgi:hypothetical protein
MFIILYKKFKSKSGEIGPFIYFKFSHNKIPLYVSKHNKNICQIEKKKKRRNPTSPPKKDTGEFDDTCSRQVAKGGALLQAGIGRRRTLWLCRFPQTRVSL